MNIPCDQHTFDINRQRALDYLNTRERLYCFDGFAGWDPRYRIKVRVICSRPYHALFMHTMLIRPTKDELANFGMPDFVIINGGAFPANRLTTGMGSTTSIDLSLEDRQLVILGTEYAGEMKKGVFTVANYFGPKRGILSMHCSATADKKTGASSLLFGLSGTGKTTLSADPKRHLIGDDEHCWSDDGIFNIEGGCYAKAINLTPESEPDIFQALRFGAVLENVVLDEDHGVDYTDTSITQNTRGAYPIEFIANAKIPCMAGHPTDVIFLTCDAFGVLPPVSALSPAHAMYHFISGYTAKVAGTEMGVTEPQATFSPCFGGPFLVWHPSKYAELLEEKMRKHNARVWLVNTGWGGGGHGVGPVAGRADQVRQAGPRHVEREEGSLERLHVGPAVLRVGLQAAVDDRREPVGEPVGRLRAFLHPLVGGQQLGFASPAQSSAARRRTGRARAGGAVPDASPCLRWRWAAATLRPAPTRGPDPAQAPNGLEDPNQRTGAAPRRSTAPAARRSPRTGPGSRSGCKAAGGDSA